MNLSDILILAAVAVAVYYAIRSWIGKRQRGDCGCGCSSCGSSSCTLRDAHNKHQ